MLDGFARTVSHALNCADHVYFNRETQSGREFLATIRELSVRQLAVARKWARWVGRVDGDSSLMEYGGLAVVISQMFFIATLDIDGEEDLVPDRAWLMTRLENSRAVPWLASRDAPVPEWLTDSE